MIDASGRAFVRAVLAVQRLGSRYSRGKTGLMLSEARLCQEFVALWRTHLTDRQLGADSDFFRCGGQSITAVLLVAEVGQRFDIDIGLSTLFNNPTPRMLAAHVARGARGADAVTAHAPLPPADGTTNVGAVPLTALQRHRISRYAAMTRRGEHPPPYNVSIAVDVHGDLDGAALTAAVDHVVRRHSALRLAVDASGAPPTAVMLPVRAAQVQVLDLRGAPSGQIDERVSAAAARPFDLSGDIKLAVTALRVAEIDWVLVLVADHLVCDGPSARILLSDLGRAYGACLSGRDPDWPEHARPYHEFAAVENSWLRGPEYERRLAYWRSALDPMDPAGLVVMPGARQPPERATPASRVLRLGGATRKAIGEAQTRYGLTSYGIVCAGVALTVAAWTGRFIVSAQTNLTLRTGAFRDTVGWFSSSAFLRWRIDPSDSVEVLARSATKTALAAMDHVLPVGDVLAALASDWYGSRRWRPRICMDIQDVDEQPVGFGPATGVVRPVGQGGGLRHGVAIWCAVTADDVLLTAQYEREGWSAGAADALLDALGYAIDAAACDAAAETGLIYDALRARPQGLATCDGWQEGSDK